MKRRFWIGTVAPLTKEPNQSYLVSRYITVDIFVTSFSQYQYTAGFFHFLLYPRKFQTKQSLICWTVRVQLQEEIMNENNSTSIWYLFICSPSKKYNLPGQIAANIDLIHIIMFSSFCVFMCHTATLLKIDWVFNK